MEIVRLDLNQIDPQIITYIKRFLDRGKVVVFPSDTCYGLAANANIPEAVSHVYEIKQRPFEKQISCIFSSISQIKAWTQIDPLTEKIMKKNLPGPFTFILDPSAAYPLAGDTVGVRIPDFDFTYLLSLELGYPFTSTSANIAGMPSTYSRQEFIEQIRDCNVKPDLFIDAGTLLYNPPSTVADTRENEVKVVRAGSGRLKV